MLSGGRGTSQNSRNRPGTAPGLHPGAVHGLVLLGLGDRASRHCHPNAGQSSEKVSFSSQFPANGMATEEAFEPPRHPGSWWISGLRSRFLTGIRTNLVCAARHALSSRDEARRAKGRAIQKDAVRLPPRRDRALIENVFGRVKCPARPTLCDKCGVKRGLSPASHTVRIYVR